MNNRIMRRAVIGELVTELTEQGFRVELCSEDGGGLHLYAAPDGGEKPDDGWEFWIRLDPSNFDPIVDYSSNFEPYIHNTVALIDFVEQFESA